MKKLSIVVILVCVILYVVFFMEYPDDKDTLYSVKFGNVKLRFERYCDRYL